MALQTSGQISMSNIANEKGETLSNVSLSELSTESINEDSCNQTNPNNGAPYFTSEFYGYDHNCVTEPSTFEISMSGGYRSPDDACGDKGKKYERWVMYSNCSPDAIGPGCFIYQDSEANEPWFNQDWYYYELTNTSYFISEGQILEILPCFK